MSHVSESASPTGGGGGSVTSVSNVDGSLIISPTTGAVIASFNPNHAFTWGALQTFGNNLSFGGVQVLIAGLVSGQILQYNGTNWINANPSGGNPFPIPNNSTVATWTAADADGNAVIFMDTGDTFHLRNTNNNVGSPNQYSIIMEDTAGGSYIGFQNVAQGPAINQYSTGGISITSLSSIGIGTSGATHPVNITAGATQDQIYLDGSGNIQLNAAGLISVNQVIQTSQSTSTLNTGVGTGALASNSGANNVTAFGYQALYQNIGGSYNSSFGGQSLFRNQSGNYNSAFGYQALYQGVAQSYNSAFGYWAAYEAGGQYNSAFGNLALFQNGSGSGNTAMGAYSLGQSTNSSQNTVLGFKAGYAYTGSETGNIVIGYNVEGVIGESNMTRIGNITLQNSLLLGLGVAGIYGAGFLVSIATTSTTIATVATGTIPAVGGHFIVKWTLSCATGTTPALSLTWTDPKSGAQNILLYSSAMVSGQTAQGLYSIAASNATAIKLAATALIAGDIFGTAVIDEEQ